MLLGHILPLICRGQLLRSGSRSCAPFHHPDPAPFPPFLSSLPPICIFFSLSRSNYNISALRKRSRPSREALEPANPPMNPKKVHVSKSATHCASCNKCCSSRAGYKGKFCLISELTSTVGVHLKNQFVESDSSAFFCDSCRLKNKSASEVRPFFFSFLLSLSPLFFFFFLISKEI